MQFSFNLRADIIPSDTLCFIKETKSLTLYKNHNYWNISVLRVLSIFSQIGLLRVILTVKSSERLYFDTVLIFHYDGLFG